MAYKLKRKTCNEKIIELRDRLKNKKSEAYIGMGFSDFRKGEITAFQESIDELNDVFSLKKEDEELENKQNKSLKRVFGFSR